MIVSTPTFTNKNASAEVSCLTYTNATAYSQEVSFQIRLSNLNAAAARLTVRIAHLTAADAVLSPQADTFTWNKNAAADTMGGWRDSIPFVLAAGEKAEILLTSSNASDTAVAGTVTVIDVSRLTADDVSTIAAAVAALILATPANLLVTDVNGRVEISGTKTNLDALQDAAAPDLSALALEVTSQGISSAVSAAGDLIAGIPAAILASQVDGAMDVVTTLKWLLSALTGKQVITGTDPVVVAYKDYASTTTVLTHSLPAAATGRTKI